MRLLPPARATIHRQTEHLRSSAADEDRRLREALIEQGIDPRQTVFVESAWEGGAWYGLLVGPGRRVYEFYLSSPTRWPQVARCIDVTGDPDYSHHEGVAHALAILGAEGGEHIDPALVAAADITQQRSALPAGAP